MPVTIDGSTGITAPAFDGAVDGADLTGSVSASLLTGTLPALNGSALTSLSAGNLTGTLPALNGSALTNLPAPTTAQVGSAIAGLSYGGVGTYGLFYCGAGVAPGGTFAGSSLQPANTFQSSAQYGGATVYGLPSGTWIAMGQTTHFNSTSSGTSNNLRTTVFMRIS